VQWDGKPSFQFTNFFQQAIGPPAEFVMGAIPEPHTKVQMKRLTVAHTLFLANPTAKSSELIVEADRLLKKMHFLVDDWDKNLYLSHR
jgi:hypothetical protein